MYTYEYIYIYIYICKVRYVFFLQTLAYIYSIDTYICQYSQKKYIFLSTLPPPVTYPQPSEYKIAAFTFWIKTTEQNLMRSMYLLFTRFFFHLLSHP